MIFKSCHFKNDHFKNHHFKNGHFKNGAIAPPLLTALLTALSLVGCSSFPTAYEAQLADHLTETGAKMYGAYWCPHCANQKREFGGAAGRLPYVECDPEGINAQAEACEAAGVEVYPTWVIENEVYLGVQPIGRLSVLSGYEVNEGELPLEGDSEPTGNYSPAQ